MTHETSQTHRFDGYFSR